MILLSRKGLSFHEVVFLKLALGKLKGKIKFIFGYDKKEFGYSLQVDFDLILCVHVFNT